MSFTTKAYDFGRTARAEELVVDRNTTDDLDVTVSAVGGTSWTGVVPQGNGRYRVLLPNTMLGGQFTVRISGTGTVRGVEIGAR